MSARPCLQHGHCVPLYLHFILCTTRSPFICCVIRVYRAFRFHAGVCGNTWVYGTMFQVRIKITTTTSIITTTWTWMSSSSSSSSTSSVIIWVEGIIIPPTSRSLPTIRDPQCIGFPTPTQNIRTINHLPSFRGGSILFRWLLVIRCHAALGLH